MNVKDLYTFIDGLCLPVHFLEFGSKFVPFPAPFSDISELNEIVDITEKEQKPPRICIKDFLKMPSLSEEPLKIDLNGKDVTDALKRLNSFFDEKNLRSLREVLACSTDEGELEIGIGIHIFKKLKGNATTNTLKAKSACPCGCNERLNPNQNMWIGTENTWYGELDILAGDPPSDSSVAIMVKDFVAGDDNVEEEEEISNSPREGTNIELKMNSDGKGFGQAASQSIVFAFTEYNRHEEKASFIPTVLIDRYYYYIFLYSPVYDSLVTTAVKYNFGPEFGEKSEFMRAILILWLVINHRIFFAKCPKLTEIRESGFSRKIQDLDKYKELKNFSYQLGAQPNPRSPQFVLGQSMLIYSNTAETIELCDEIQSRIIQRPK